MLALTGAIADMAVVPVSVKLAGVTPLTASLKVTVQLTLSAAVFSVLGEKRVKDTRVGAVPS